MEIANKTFSRELEEIAGLGDTFNGPVVSQFVGSVMDKIVPPFFWTEPASSSGKYHPASSLGRGGLVKHTKQVFWIAKTILDSQMFTVAYPQSVLAACLLHDGWKYTDSKSFTLKFHATRAVQELRNHASSLISSRDWFDVMLSCILTHNGRFTKEWDGSKLLPEARIVHIADYVASRPFNIFDGARI